MKKLEKIRSVRRIKSTILIFLVVLLATIGAADAAITVSFTNTTVAGTVNAPLGIQFYGSSSDPNVTWAWDFNELGGTSAVQNPLYTFQYAGVHDVTLKASNLSDPTNNGTATKAILVNMLPIFSVTPPVGPANLSVNFNDASTGHPQLWNWSFGDGTFSNGTSPSVSHTYAIANTYTVNETVTANAVSNLSQNTIITVNPQPTIVSITPTSQNDRNVTATFIFNGSSTGNPIAWFWQFGDGSTASTQNATYNYSSLPNYVANTYHVNLTTTGLNGTTGKTQDILLAVRPIAHFTPNPVTIVAGNKIRFDASTSLGLDNNATYDWDFGDHSPDGSNKTSDYHVYGPGKYIVILNVTENGLSDTTTGVVNTDSSSLYPLRTGINGNTYYFVAPKYGLSAPGTIWFNAYPTRQLLNSQLINSVQGNIGTQYSWQIIGGNDPVGHNFIYSSLSPSTLIYFPYSDIYTVILKVTDSRDTYTITKPRLVVVKGGV